MGLCFESSVEPPSGELEEPETSPQRATGWRDVKNFYVLQIRLPFAVKFLGS